MGLINTYKTNDSVFTVEEAQQLERLITNNKDALKKTPETYADICFETGKLFWYYYNYGDGSDNFVTRAKRSIEWFQNALEYSPQDYKNRGMATVYANVGIFYRDISTAITEASDKGKYKYLFSDLNELINTVAVNENESEMVRLELLELARNAIQQYSTKFKGDGISQDDLNKMLDNIENISNSINATEGVPQEKKDSVLNLIPDTRQAIETAYST